MVSRCSDYWSLDQAWRKAENDAVMRSDGTARERLMELRLHLRTCTQCASWWNQMKELMKNERRFSNPI